MGFISRIKLLIRKNIANNAQFQNAEEILEIAKMMNCSEKAKIIALKLIKGGLKSKKREKFSKTLTLISYLINSESLKKYLKINLEGQLGCKIYDSGSLHYKIAVLRPLNKIVEEQSCQKISDIKTMFFDLLRILNFHYEETDLRDKLLSLGCWKEIECL